MSDPLTAVMVVGALFSVNTIGQESGCGPGCAQLPGSAAHYAHTPCPTAVYPAAAPLQGGGGFGKGGGHQFYAGHAPTPAYMSGTQYYGYSLSYGAPAGFSQYAGASKYYHD